MKPLILFVCRHNTGRSQMAEAYFRYFAGDLFEAASAGTIQAEKPEPVVVTAMAEDGIDISSARPKLIDPAVALRASVIVTMGCDVEGIDHVDEDWGLPDPKGQSLDRVRQIRDLIKSKAQELAERLGGAASMDRSENG